MDSLVASELQCSNAESLFFGSTAISFIFVIQFQSLQGQILFSVGFNKLSNKEGVYSMDASYVSVPSVKECAIICQNITSSNAFTCMSFDYCSGTKLCQLSKTRTPDGNMLKQNIACDHYYSKLILYNCSFALHYCLSLSKFSGHHKCSYSPNLDYETQENSDYAWI